MKETKRKKENNKFVITDEARRFKRVRQDENLTQLEMAEVLGLKQPSVHRYEIGESFIPTTVWKKIHVKFQYSLEYLLNGQGKKKITEGKKEGLITDIKDIQQKYEILAQKYEDLNKKMNKLYRDFYSKFEA